MYKNGTVLIALSLSALLGLSACGNAASSSGQAETSVQSAASTTSVVSSESATSAVSSAGSQSAAATTSSSSSSPVALSAAAEKQSIGLTSVGNARQLGGYVGEGGKKVKDGVLLRTAALGNASEEDITRLKDVYHLGEIIDFRMGREVEADPEIEIDGVKGLNLLIMDEEAMAQRMAELTDEDLEGIDPTDSIGKIKLAMKTGVVGDQMYVNFLSHDVGKQGYAQMFKELLALPEGESLLFHCTQGKDRTGCAAMLILSALGVDEETIMSDYLLTNEFNAELIARERQELLDSGMKESEVDEIMLAKDQVYPQIMTNALDWIKENYGSVKGYITKELGVTEEQIAQLQEKFLA